MIQTAIVPDEFGLLFHCFK